jgi:hypothetical protein
VVHVVTAELCRSKVVHNLFNIWSVRFQYSDLLLPPVSCPDTSSYGEQERQAICNMSERLTWSDMWSAECPVCKLTVLWLGKMLELDTHRTAATTWALREHRHICSWARSGRNLYRSLDYKCFPSIFFTISDSLLIWNLRYTFLKSSRLQSVA